MNILVINQPLNNRGDESAHKGFLRKLTSSIPNVNVKVLCEARNDNTISQFDVQIPNVEYVSIKWMKYGRGFVEKVLQKNKTSLWNLHPNVWLIRQQYKWADLIVVAPGGICMGGFQNWNHLFYVELAKQMKKKIAYYGRSIGPFPVQTTSNRVFKDISLKLLRYFDFLSLRDKKSEKLSKELGINYYSTLDSAFLDAPKVLVPDELKVILDKKKYVVFVPNVLIWHFAYKGKADMKDIIAFYEKVLIKIQGRYKDHNVIMLPQTFNYQTPLMNDVNFFKSFKEAVKNDSLYVFDDVYSSDIQQTIIASADCVVGARYHSVVFSLNQATPFVALSYEHKIAGLLETLSKEDCMVDITKIFDNEEEQKVCLAAIDTALQKATRDMRARDNAKNIANNCFDKFVKYVESV